MCAGSSGLCGQLSAEPVVASTSASEPGRVGGWVWGKFSFIRCSDEHNLRVVAVVLRGWVRVRRIHSVSVGVLWPRVSVFLGH